MSGRRHRPGAVSCTIEQLRGYALHLLTNVRFGMTPTFGSTLDGTSGCGMKRVAGADAPWQFIEIFLSSDD